MLLNLVINNFAIIDRLDVAFGAGFNVLTGETGAGKSIIMGAVGLLLGDRASPELVRTGAEEATIEALFDIADDADFRRLLAEQDFPAGEELVLRRVISRSGRSRAYVNGSLVTLGQWQPLAEKLVSICGQHEHQALLHREAHLAMLDQFGKVTADVAAYREVFLELQQVKADLAGLAAAERDRRQRIDFLRHQSEEISKAGLAEEEEEALQAERRLLQHAERLTGLTQAGYESLYGAEGAVCEKLGALADELRTAAEIDPQFAIHAEVLQRVLYELEDVALQLRSQASRMVFEPGRQDEVEERLALLARLKRRYAPSIAEILAYQQECDREIDQLESAGETQEALLHKQQQLAAKLQTRGRQISEARRRTAEQMEKQVMAELADLAMPGTRFQVSLTPLEEPALSGLERIEFLISPNRGEALRPLGRVASGGELSRILLALKRIAPQVEDVPTVVFDEVDAGIGGATATSVGRKLHDVSRSAQVLCVTHLPQVAAFADRHYRVAKYELDDRTQTQLTWLEENERVEEMARMLGGAQVTDLTLDNARQLIKLSRQAVPAGEHHDS
ncbi:MAG TPA: DNA repair protein RecN [Desulfuromonadales bacterium]|nr:DNA repair protein RecN [Desulfuromonadales bacterium]